MATIYENIAQLGKIVTDAITAGDTSTLPEKAVRTTLVRIATGSYKETLPIMVPAECCIMGDELRATNVQPRTIYNTPDLTPKTDFWYSYAGMSRMEEIIGDVVSGVAVTPTSGNTLDQNVSWPYAENPQAKQAVIDLTRNVKRRSDIGLGLKQEARKTLTRANDLLVPENGHARDLIWRNADFLKAEIVAYLTEEYPDLDYSRTKCKQDVGFIIDALAYDLTYGGNWQTQNAGLAYYNGASGTLQIDSEEKTATLAAYNYLKALMQTVQRNITVTPVYQTDESQVVGEGGGASQSTTIGTLIDDMIDIVDNGPANASISYPSLVGVNANLITASTACVNELPTIQEETIDFIAKNFGSFRYDAAKCRRDLTNILSDVAFDVAFGTNYNQVYNGIAYQRGNSAYLLNNQKKETIGAIRYARNIMADEITDSAAETAFVDGVNEVVDIIRNGTISTTEPGDGVADALVFPNPAGADQNRIDAKELLIANREFIQADTRWYVENTYNNPPGSFVYNADKCERDVGYIVDALTYDILYGGTAATTRVAESYFVNGETQVYGQEVQTTAAYAHASSIIQQIVQEQTVTAQAGHSILQTTLGSPATATESTELDNKITIITDAITAGNLNSLPAAVLPSITWASATLQTEKAAIDSARAQVIVDTIQYISDTYNDFNYDHAKCQRDLGLLLDAARYDWMLGTEYATVIAAYSYLRRPSAKVTGDQKDATLAANEFARIKLQEVLDANPTGNVADESLAKSWEWIQDTIWAGSAEGGNKAVADQEVWNAIRMLELNKDFIAEEVVVYVNNYFKAQVTNTTGANPGGEANYLTIDDTSWLELGMPVKFSIEAGDTETDLGQNVSIQVDQEYFVREVMSDTDFRVEDIQGNIASFTTTTTTYTISKSYDYNQDICKRDVREYVNAMKWDLEWPQQWERKYTDGVELYLPGAYKTRLAVRYYVNSVIGSQEEDFYYMRNGTGLRLQSLDGLNGDLSPDNDYGTKRPTAGAYASLDPGWGPEDRRVWISARSPYMQNCTCFGNAAIGQKIDGALHNGGNDSMVSNDFTQVISDGIGAWITNNGRAELVSVFTYYAHIGYLAEQGGRIRATNGNNSYGSFGSVAEGVDPDETPVTGIVDNSGQYNATVSNVFTDTDKILALEFGHAGNDYTEAQFDIFGAGDGEVVVGDEFRDNAVNRVRVFETNPDTAGGTGYTVVSNTAQAGSLTDITLAATDGSISSAYPGMKVFITGGAAVGQYATIDTYNSGSKIATVLKDDGTPGWEHVLSGTPIVSPNGSSTYQVEPGVVFSAPPTSRDTATLASSQTHSKLHYMETAAQYVNLATTTNSDGSGATFDVTRNGEKYYLTLNNTGQEYVRLDQLTIPGTSVDGASPANNITITVTTVDATDGSIVDFDFDGVGSKGKFFVFGASGSTYNVSDDGETWTTDTLAASLATRDAASGLLDDGSSTYKPSAMVIVGNNTTTAQYTADGENWATSTIGTNFGTNENGIAFGDGAFVVVNPNTTDVAYSLNGGSTWTVTTAALPGTGYQKVVYGMGLFIAIDPGTTNIAWSNDKGITWNAASDVTGLTARNWVDITWGNSRFVAVADTGATAYSLDGDTWLDGATNAIPGAGSAVSITYGQGIFVLGLASSLDTVSSEDGINWSTVASNTGRYVAFGNPNQLGKFVFADTSGTNAWVGKFGARARGRASVASEKVFEIRMLEPGSNYTGGLPTVTLTDPGNIDDVELVVRLGNGVLGNPSWVSRGANFIQASAEVNDEFSNGGADFFQDGQFVAVRRLTERPVSGSNVVFDSIPNTTFKLVNTVSFRGTNDGSYTAFLQLSPEMSIADAPVDGDPVTLRIRFSQVRLTGHDFLDIGTGGFTSTNYPGLPFIQPDADRETQNANGGRVFFTSTDQDGNFRVGDLFQIEQATGVATLNADAFNIAGLQELTLGEVTLGGNSAAVNEFSTDPFFTANSDNVVPTQRAVKAYIEAQIGGGGAQLNVNSVTAGDIFVNTNQITTVSGEKININANVNFTKTVLGLPIAYNYFLR